MKLGMVNWMCLHFDVQKDKLEYLKKYTNNGGFTRPRFMKKREFPKCQLSPLPLDRF